MVSSRLSQSCQIGLPPARGEAIWNYTVAVLIAYFDRQNLYKAPNMTPTTSYIHMKLWLDKSYLVSTTPDNVSMTKANGARYWSHGGGYTASLWCRPAGEFGMTEYVTWQAVLDIDLMVGGGEIQLAVAAGELGTNWIVILFCILKRGINLIRPYSSKLNSDIGLYNSQEE